MTVIRKWDFCGEDTVSDNDTSGKAARSEKVVFNIIIFPIIVIVGFALIDVSADDTGQKFVVK